MKGFINAKQYVHLTLCNVQSSQCWIRNVIRSLNRQKRKCAETEFIIFHGRDWNFFKECSIHRITCISFGGWHVGYNGLWGMEMANLCIEIFDKCPDGSYDDAVRYNVSKQVQSEVSNKLHVPKKHACYITGFFDCIDNSEG